MFLVINLLSVLINVVFFINPVSVSAEETPLNKKIGGFEIRTYKRKEEHIHTAALICSLLENNSSEDIIEDAWKSKLEYPVNPDDEYLVRFIMMDMCPKASKTYFKGFK